MEHLLPPGRVKDCRLPVNRNEPPGFSGPGPDTLEDDQLGRGGGREKEPKEEEKKGRIKAGEIIVEETRGEATNDRRQ